MSLTNDTGTTMLVQPAYGNGGGGFGDMFGGNGMWFIILFLIFGMFGGGWGNWGGGNSGLDTLGLVSALGGMSGGGSSCGSEVQRGFDHSSVIQKLDGITNGQCDGFYTVNSNISNGFHGVDSAICNLGYQTQSGFNATQVAMMQGNNALQAQLAQCCCDNREAIANVRYDMATQDCATRNLIQNVARDITDNANGNTRAILDFLTQDKIATLTAENQNLKLAASQANQNAYLTATIDAANATLIRRLGIDCPQPAYLVNAPTPINFPTNSCGQVVFGNNGCGNCGF